MCSSVRPWRGVAILYSPKTFLLLNLRLGNIYNFGKVKFWILFY
ncbi:hypothetical protein NSP_6530 [Nodularia spumigena CCY9414]|nr:hypothetical protein NSP_6530 [Nodularia spumigena CCY9414]